MRKFDHLQEERREFVLHTFSELEQFYSNSRAFHIAPEVATDEVKAYVRSQKFDNSKSPKEIIEYVIGGLKKYAVHVPHPGYYGLFNPRTSYMSALADYISGVMNPQMAAWSHAPFANEVERYVVEEFAKKFGYEDGDGTFCSGGAESNLTALQTALNFHFPEVSQDGVINLSQRPVIYCSSESHHSIVKAARTVGLGSKSVISLKVNDDLKMNVQSLEDQIRKDIKARLRPFMVVATAGTTGTGAIDDISSISKIARVNNLWLHVDGAYGAAVIISKRWKHLLSGIYESDSITLDLHKWFSVPMGGSLFLTSRAEILYKTYSIQTSYMPPDGDQQTQIDPYLHSIQWSRRFVGLKFFLPLAVHGWQAYEEMIDDQIDLADQLRTRLSEAGWKIRNDTRLPVVCFEPEVISQNQDTVDCIGKAVVESGKAWVSIYPVNGKSTIRACITNYATTEQDIEVLVDTLNEARDALA